MSIDNEISPRFTAAPNKPGNGKLFHAHGHYRPRRPITAAAVPRSVVPRFRELWQGLRLVSVRPDRRDSDWRDTAACGGMDVDIFFPLGPSFGAEAAEAKRICFSCPVQEPCLQWATATGVDHGVWGGFTEEERRTMRHRQARRPR